MSCCVVCYEDTTNCQLSCKHHLCISCILQITQEYCPYCRQPLRSDTVDLTPYLAYMRYRQQRNKPQADDNEELTSNELMQIQLYILMITFAWLIIIITIPQG